MNRAGREPAEDVLRQIVAACQAVGLSVGKRMMHLLPDRRHRFIVVDASRKGWPHELPMLEVQTFIDLFGNVGEVKILCAATDADPFESIWIAPRLRNAEVPLDALPSALRMILRERDAVIQMISEGRKPPFPGIHWTWEVVDFLEMEPGA